MRKSSKGWLNGEAQGRTVQDQIAHVMRKHVHFTFRSSGTSTVWNLSTCLFWTQIQEWNSTRYSIRNQNLIRDLRGNCASLLYRCFPRICVLLHRHCLNNSTTRCRMTWRLFQDGVLKSMRSESAGFSWYREHQRSINCRGQLMVMQLWSGEFISH